MHFVHDGPGPLLRVGGVLTSPDDLAVLLRQAQAGDAAAFDIIFQRYANPLYRYLYARCGDVATAEDVASSTWERAVEHFATFRWRTSHPEADFAAWLYRIGRNLLTDTFRRSGRSTVPLTDELATSDQDFDDYIIANEANQELATALMQLTVEQREVVVLRFLQERSTAEVAAITGRSEGAVKALQHRALASLARLLTIKL